MRRGLQVHDAGLPGTPREVAIQTDRELTIQKSCYLEDVFDTDYPPDIAVSAGNQETSGRMSNEQKKTIQVAQLFSRRYGLSSLIPRPGQSHINYCAKKQRVGSYCPFDCLPESILHDIFSRLSIPDLLIARQSCVSWYRIVSSCQIFQKLYDERNHESWIALCSSSRLNPNGFVLFNANDAKQYHFLSLAQHVADPMTKSWLLQGVADGLMLLASREGRLAVANPLTRRFRLLPDAKLSSRLRLESCLKKKLWQPRLKKKPWQPHHLPSISINIFGDSASKSFKVMVWGELRNKQVHVLVYNSRTDTWTIQLCPEIDHNLFRHLSHSTTDGTTIYCNSNYRHSVRPRRMVSYNTETLSSVVEEMPGMDLSGIDGTRLERVQTIGMVAYKSQIFLLGILAGILRPLILVGLWAANPSTEQWKLVTKTPLEWGSMNPMDFGSCEAAAAYDGKQSVSIIVRKGWRMRLLKLNLETNEWKKGGNPEQITWSTLTSAGASEDKNEPFKAFQMELKFCTAM